MDQGRVVYLPVTPATSAQQIIGSLNHEVQHNASRVTVPPNNLGAFNSTKAFFDAAWHTYQSEFSGYWSEGFARKRTQDQRTQGSSYNPLSPNPDQLSATSTSETQALVNQRQLKGCANQASAKTRNWRDAAIANHILRNYHNVAAAFLCSKDFRTRVANTDGPRSANLINSVRVHKLRWTLAIRPQTKPTTRSSPLRSMTSIPSIVRSSSAIRKPTQPPAPSQT